MTTGVLAIVNKNCFYTVPRCLENILDKKVHSIALNFFEKCIDWLCMTFYPAYRNLYQTKCVTPLNSSTSIIAEIETALPVASIDPVATARTRDLQKAGIYGQAVGDAFGLMTEFVTRDEARALVPDLQELIDRGHLLITDPRFRQGPGAAHRTRFNPGWTDDTDQAIALVRALDRKRHGDARSEAQLFADELLQWIRHGLTGRTNAKCMGLGTLVSNVTSKPHFAQNPSQAALDVWRDPRFSFGEIGMHYRPAANGAVMRTSVIPMIYHRNLSQMVQKTIEMCKVTHRDPRCIASCVAVTMAMAMMLRGERDWGRICATSSRVAKAVLADEMSLIRACLAPHEDYQALTRTYQNELEAHMLGDYSVLNLDEGWATAAANPKGNRIGYTYKCMGAAFHALREAIRFNNPARALYDLIREGGDADTNGAVAGAMIGCYFGWDAFPPSWKAIPDQAVLEDTLQRIQTLSVRS